MAHTADDGTPPGLQFRQPRLDDVRLLAAFEMFAPLPDPLLAFVNQVGKLIDHLRSKKLQQTQPKEQVHLDVLVIFGPRQRTLQKLSKQLPEAAVIGPAGRAKIYAGKVGPAGVLANEVEKIIAGDLDESGAQEDVVMDIIHADRQRSHGDRDVIALEFDPGRFGCAG